jgi:hypothetical protein
MRRIPEHYHGSAPRRPDPEAAYFTALPHNRELRISHFKHAIQTPYSAASSAGVVRSFTEPEEEK